MFFNKHSKRNDDWDAFNLWPIFVIKNFEVRHCNPGYKWGIGFCSKSTLFRFKKFISITLFGRQLLFRWN